MLVADIREPHVRRWRKERLDADVSAVTARQVFDPASAIDPRCQALLLLAVFGSLRWGELVALRRADIDLNAQTVRVSATGRAARRRVRLRAYQVRCWQARGRHTGGDRAGRPGARRAGGQSGR
jgi:integrase